MVNPEFQNNPQAGFVPPVQQPCGQPHPSPLASDGMFFTAAPAVPKRTLQKHDSVFAWLSLLLGFLFMRYVLVYADGFVTTGFFLLLFFGSAVYVRKSGCKPTAAQWGMGAAICIFSAVFSLTASALLHGLCFVFLLAAQVWWVHAVCNGTRFVTRYFPLDLSDSIFVQPFREYTAAPAAISDSMKKSSSAKTIRTVLLGLLITVPLTVIVGALLASADSAVEEIFTTLGKLLTDEVVTIAAELVFGIPVSFWFFGMLFSGGRRRTDTPMADDETHAERLAAFRFVPNLGLYAGVTPICLLYLLYVCTQTSYFLSAFAGRLPGDMIYSDYARRGFFELCAIAVINLLVLLVLNGCAKNGGSERPKALTFYVTLLCGFTLFIIATALAKMVLYINAYGLTRLRLYTAWFMVLLAVVFIVLIVRQFAKKFPTAAVLTAVFTVLFAVLCFSRPDALIAEYNITRYERGTLSELDAQMLCGLSDDAYAVMQDHMDTLTTAGEADYFLSMLDCRIRYDYAGHPDQKWNLSAQLLLHSGAEV